MKKLLGIIVLGFLLGATSANSQDYDCSYDFEGETFPFSLIKKNLHSYIFKQNDDSVEYILEETNEVLLLGHPRYVKGERKAYRIVWLDKVSNLITITTLIEPRMSRGHSGGVWGYAVGSCEKITR